LAHTSKVFSYMIYEKRAVVAVLLPPYGRDKVDMTSEGSTIAREKA